MGRFVVGVVVGGDMVVGMLGFLDLGLSLLSSHFHRGRERERKMGNNRAKEAEDPKGKAKITVVDFPINPDDKISKL